VQELERLIAAASDGARDLVPDLMRQFEHTVVWFHDNSQSNDDARVWEAWTREGSLRAYLRRTDPRAQARIGVAPGADLLATRRASVRLNAGTPLAAVFERGGVRTRSPDEPTHTADWPNSVADEGFCPHCDAELVETDDSYCPDCGRAVRESSG
jgi:hypothetical protein